MSASYLVRRIVPALAIGTLLVLVAVRLGILPSSAETVRVVSAPAVDISAGPATAETAVLAGGCFWGVQGVFQHVEGVTSAVSGYAGGAKNTAQYEIVSSGGTGHAESVRVTFDPHRISYGRILQIYFSVAHDPTELNRQGPDVGTQYRSAIFYTSESQAKIAKAYIDQLTKAKAFDKPIVTQISRLNAFNVAEDYHQDYARLHPYQPYIVINDAPKVKNLHRDLASLYVEPGVFATR